MVISSQERLGRIWRRTVLTNNNKGVEVVVNKLDFLWLYAVAETAADMIAELEEEGEPISRIKRLTTALAAYESVKQ